MYLLTEVFNPYYTDLHICHSRLFIDLEDGAMAWVDNKDPDERKMWHEVASFGGSGLRRWIYEKSIKDPNNNHIYYSIEEVKDLQPCDVVKQMKLDIQ